MACISPGRTRFWNLVPSSAPKQIQKIQSSKQLAEKFQTRNQAHLDRFKSFQASLLQLTSRVTSPVGISVTYHLQHRHQLPLRCSALISQLLFIVIAVLLSPVHCACSNYNPTLANATQQILVFNTEAADPLTYDVSKFFTNWDQNNCGNDEYILSASGDLSPTIHSKVSLTGKILTVLVDTKLQADLYITGHYIGRSEFQSQSIKVIVDSVCFSSNRTVLGTPPLIWYIQVNKQSSPGSFIVNYKEAAQLEAMWSSPTNPLCTLSDWQIIRADNDQLITSSDTSLYQLLNYAQKTTMSNLVLNTQSTNYNQQTFDFKIRAVLRATTGLKSYNNPATTQVQVVMGCTEEKLTKTFTEDPQLNYKNFGSLDTARGVLTMVFPKIVDGNEVTIQFNLKDVISLSGDLDKCGASEIKAYLDNGLTTATNFLSKSSILFNPTTRDPTSRTVDPVVQIKYGTSQIEPPYTIYLQAKGDTLTGMELVTKKLTLMFDLCSDSPSSQKESPQALTPLIQGRKTGQFNLDSIFNIKYRYPRACSGTTYSVTQVDSFSGTYPVSISGSFLTVNLTQKFTYIFKIQITLTQSQQSNTWVFTQEVKSTCFSEVLVPTQDVFRFQTQVNQLNNDTGTYYYRLVNYLQLPQLFSSPVELQCGITKYFITADDSDQRLAVTHPIAKRMLMNDDGNVELRVDTKSMEQKIEIIKFRMYVVLENDDRIVNPKWANIEVELNCQNETFSKVWTKKEDNILVNSQNLTNTHIIVPRTPETSLYKINVERVFTLEPDYFGCFPDYSQASLLKNMTTNVTSSDLVRLESIPTYQGEDNRLHPVIVIETGPKVTAIQNLTLVVMKQVAYRSFVGLQKFDMPKQSTMDFTFEVCNDTPSAFLSPQNISLSQGAPVSEFTISEAFNFSYKYPRACSGEAYYLSTKPNRRSSVKFHSISEEGKLVINTNVESQQTIYLVLELTQSQTYASVEFNITVVNNPPQWSEELQLDHLVQIKYDSDGNVFGEPYYVYRSPKLTDPDFAVQSLIFDIGPFSKAPFISTQKTNDNVNFTIIVDKQMVEKPGVFSTTLTYGDQFTRTPIKQQLTITIQQIKPENVSSQIVQDQQQLEQQQANSSSNNESKTNELDESTYYYYDNNQTNSEKEQMKASEYIEASRLKFIKKQEAIKVKQFEELGFKRVDGIGLVFPDVQIAASDIKNGSGQAPKVMVSQVSQLGEFKVSFDQNMMLPNRISDLILNKVFEFQLTSEIDNSKRIGKVKTKEKQEERELQSVIDDHEFYVSFKSVSPTEIGFQAHFTDINRISQGNSKDTFSVRILEPQVFKSEAGALSLELDSEDLFEKGIPPMINDEESVGYTNAIDGICTFTLVILIFNFLVCHIIGTTLQPFWGLVRALQYLIICFLVNVPIQAFAYRIYQQCANFARFDIFKGQSIFNLITFRTSEPWSYNFELLYFTNSNFLQNSSSYFIIMAVIIILNLLCSITNILAIVFSRFKFCRRIGMLAYSDSRLDDIASHISKLFLESYIQLCIISILALCEYIQVDEAGESMFGLFFKSPQDIICTLIALVHLLLLVVYPVWCVIKVSRNYKQFNLKTVKEQCKVQIQENKYDTWINANYQFQYMVRRVSTVAILIFLHEQPFIQCASLIAINTVSFGFIVSNQPMANKRLNRLLTFNELSITFFLHLITNLQNISIPDELKIGISWAMILILALILLVNLAYLGATPFFQLNQFIKTKMLRHKIQTAISINYMNRKYLKAQYGLELKYFDSHRVYLTAISKCQEWGPHRRWLIKNRINPAWFKEEAEFQELAKQVGLIEKARLQKFEKALKYSIKKHTVERIEEQRTKLMQKYQNLDDILDKAQYDQNVIKGDVSNFIEQQRKVQIKLDKIAANKHQSIGLDELNASIQEEPTEDAVEQFDAQVKPLKHAQTSYLQPDINLDPAPKKQPRKTEIVISNSSMGIKSVPFAKGDKSKINLQSLINQPNTKSVVIGIQKNKRQNSDLAMLMKGSAERGSEESKDSFVEQNNNKNYSQQYYNNIPSSLKKKMNNSKVTIDLSRKSRLPEIIEEPVAENEERKSTYWKGGKHTIKDVDLNPTQKQSIFRQINQEAFKNPLLSKYDGSNLDFFNMDALKQIEQLIGIMTYSHDTKQKEEIYKIVQSELSLLNKYQMNYEQIVLYEELISQEQELKRLMNPLRNEDSSSEDYGEEVYTRLFDNVKETLLEDFKRVTALKVMTQAGENDYLQAVLQPVMDIPELAEYMIMHKFKTEPNKKEKQIFCEMLSTLYKIMFQKQFEVLGEDHEITIDFIMHKIRRRFSPEQKHDAFVFFEHLVNRITGEIGFNHENTEHLVFKALMVGTEITETCENDHCLSRIALSPFHSLKFKQPIIDYLELVFSPSEQKRKCREKKCKSQVLQTTQEIRFLPSTMIFVYPTDDLLADDDPQEPPLEIDLDKFQSFVSRIEKPITVYELTSIISFVGEKMEETEYSVYIRRTIKSGKDQGKTFWLKFSQNFRETCELQDALDAPNKTMIIYSRKTKE